MTIEYINGKFLTPGEAAVPVEERGHQFGDGVYEVIRFYGGTGFMLKEHLDRLERSAEEIKIQLKDGIGAIQKIIEEGVERSGMKDCYVYLQVTRGAAPRNHLFPLDTEPSIAMTVKPAVPLPQEKVNEGVSVITHPDERWANCYIKSLNLLPNILAKQTAYEQGCYEAVLHKDGRVTEASSSNIFIVKGDTVITTPLSREILPGITRMAVKDVCDIGAIRLEERHFTVDELKQADEVFVTSTTSEVLPVTKIDEKPVKGGSPGNLTKLIRELFCARTAES
ncbi:D-amino-acid transaminase [Alteribacter natronophilus]|uniref:D-amino-acid transaminase n=1 Tax=Alteribacter natronophilus TaxID=2583810 RepID=UPI00110D4CFF|nr:D-amino-acid transaminase [Alteribacter natronophilus]TMW71842.1 D-amino-acid transaminase [Alteribacter natronophilus]